jgi:hypothetical protein
MEAYTVKNFSTLLIAVLLVTASTALTLRAQTTSNQTAVATAPFALAGSNVMTNEVTTTARSQAMVNSLSTLPEADTLIYINTQRILNDLLPKLLPAKDLEGMRKAFEDVKKNAGVDPARIEYIVIACRFKKPTDDLNFQAPQFMVLSSGDFSADGLMTLAHMAAQGKLRDEKYGSKTMGLMTIDPLAKEAEKNPFLKAFTEVGVVSLNGNTIATGTPAYLRAAIDAADGKERISIAALNSLVRDPNALISVAGSPWHSFAKSFGMLGTENKPRDPRCETRMGDFYAALTMDATNFMIRGTSNADNPDTAKILANLYSGLLKYATASIPDPAAQSVLKGLAITADGDEIHLNADVPQQMVIELIQQQMKPKPMVETTEMKSVTKPAVKGRRTRRWH